MDLTKQRDFFDPDKIEDVITIIGVGATGSALAYHLARAGFTKFNLYDTDVVEAKNIVNQHFTEADIGQPKVKAAAKMITQINSKAEITIHNTLFNQNEVPLVSGYVFLAVDSMETTYALLKELNKNRTIKGIIAPRTSLTEGQVYTATTTQEKQALLNYSNFKDSEVKQQLSACGGTLGTMPTVIATVAIAVANFIKLLKKESYESLLIIDPFKATLAVL